MSVWLLPENRKAVEAVLPHTLLSNPLMKSRLHRIGTAWLWQYAWVNDNTQWQTDHAVSCREAEALLNATALEWLASRGVNIRIEAGNGSVTGQIVARVMEIEEEVG